MIAEDHSNLQSQKFIYTQCNVCGNSCIGPRVNHIAKANKLSRIFFDHSWRGSISSQYGLTLFTPEHTKYTNINEKGTYEIIFKAKENPQIRMKKHDCSVTLGYEKGCVYLGFITPSENNNGFTYESCDGTVSQYSNGEKLTLNWNGELIEIEVYPIGIFINGQQYAAHAGIYKIDFFPPASKSAFLPGNHKFVLTKI